MNEVKVGGKKHRIQSLDVIRGVSILGVLAVNADGFAVPIRASLNPGAWPFPNQGATAFAYWVMDCFFHEKFVALFSMLFGISLFLVGGELRDKKKGLNLTRRLLALVVLALAHGFGLWWGDILITYAIAGILMFSLRSLSSRALLTIGICVLLGSAYRALPDLGPVASVHDQVSVSAMNIPVTGGGMSPAIAAQMDVARSSAQGAYRVNTETYLHQIANLWRLLPNTLALMMIGLALFKSGFFANKASNKACVITATVGALALGCIGVTTWSADVFGVQATLAAFVNATLAPLVALGYAAVLMLTLRGAAAPILSPFAAAGRMAFTNYVTQSLIMTSIFYGGRGALMGQVDRPGLWAIVVGVWIVQLCWSVLWLRRFEMGPLEWMWRWVTYGHRSPFLRERVAQAK